MVAFLDEVVLDALIDLLKLLPFLFLTYLLMETLEHRAGGYTEKIIRRVGNFGPLLGGAIGAVPQCGFSAAAANLYTGRVLTAGTLLAVFLSTSDEMLPILLSAGVAGKTVLALVLSKVVIGVAVGFVADGVLRLLHRERDHMEIDELCEHDHCHCERGILHSALHHTLSISLFLLIVTLCINSAVFFLGEETIASVFHGNSVAVLFLCALVGLIPNCAASVLLSQLFVDGLIGAGALLAGLLPGAGVGILVLFRVNRHKGENLALLAVLVVTGVVCGLLAECTPLGALFV